LLLRINWRQTRIRFAMAAVCSGVVSPLRDRIASRLGELFRIAAAVYDKLQIVVGFGKRLLAGTFDKLRLADFGKGLIAGTFDKLKPKSADKELAKSISLNIHRHFLGFSGFRLFTQRVKGQNDEKARGYWVNRIFQFLIGGFGLKFVGPFLAAFSPIF